MSELKGPERISIPIGLPQVIDGLLQRIGSGAPGRIACKKPRAKNRQNKPQSLQQPIARLKRKADLRRLSGGLDGAPLKDLAQKDPGLPGTETETEKPVAGAQTPRASASAPFRVAPDAPGPDSKRAPVIQMPEDEPMACKRTDGPAYRTAHHAPPFEKNLDLIPARKENIHLRNIRKRGPITKRKKEKRRHRQRGIFPN
jgi:hypothetical protein